MSECQGLRCDRCGARSLLPEQGSSIPDGWSVFLVTRAKPFYKAQKDLCDACTEQVFAALLEKDSLDAARMRQAMREAMESIDFGQWSYHELTCLPTRVRNAIADRVAEQLAAAIPGKF